MVGKHGARLRWLPGGPVPSETQGSAMISIAKTWGRAAGVLGVVSVLTLGSAVASPPAPNASAAWDLALSGRADEAFDRIELIAQDEQSGALQAALERRAEHLESIETKRAERLEEARGELAGYLEEGDAVQALRSAVEIHTLSPSKQDVLRQPEIAALVKDAASEAQRFERAGDWLGAYELYYRLNLLYEQAGTYRESFDRVGRRLVMLRLYVPETLHEMRSDKLVADGEEPLPAYNGLADDWQAKLSGVSQSMLIRALNRAERSHVEHADLTAMLVNGLETLKTFVTTEALAPAFPSFTSDKKVAGFVNMIEQQQDELRRQSGKAGYFELVSVLKNVTRANEKTLQISETALLHEFGNGAMSQLDDFSAIIWPDEVEQLQRSTQGKFTGVGIKIGHDDSQAIKVITPLQGTPAQRAGVLPGDLIIKVDDESTIGISLQQAVDRITGEEGTDVTLTLERPGVADPIALTMERDEIPIYSIKGWRRCGAGETDWDWFIDRENKIGIVRITQFAEDTTREFRRAIREMRAEGLNGLILDLRFNPGGLLSEAVTVSNLFVDEGVIVSQHDAEGIERESQRARRGRAELGDVPVVVLINEGSASASEIVSGCLQDHERALIVGTRSYGKGSVQNVYTIGSSELALLKLTTQYYYLPSGRLIHRRPGAETWGVEPDVSVEMLPSQIADSLRVRQDADLYHADADADDATDPTALITDGIDTQLETALLLLQSQAAPAAGSTAVTLRDSR